MEDASSTSRQRPSPRSRPSAKASPESASLGSGRRLTPTALTSLAARHGLRPRKALGQHFLIEPALATRIVELAGVHPGDAVVEVGPGLGSLTVALAEAGARVLAVDIDPALLPALEEVTSPYAGVRVVIADALRADWESLLRGESRWSLVANLPYNVAVPVVMRLLDEQPVIQRQLVMVQREVGERLAAGPRHPQYGAVSVKVAYRADARVVRRVPRSVFWPQPNVDSVLVEMVRRPPRFDVDEGHLFGVITCAFAERRKTMRAALIRLGLEPRQAEAVLAACGIERRSRPEELGLDEFACLAATTQRLLEGFSTGA